MPSLLFSCVVGDMVIGKPKLKEVYHSASVADALNVLIELNDFEVPVWKPSRKRSSDRAGTSVEKYESPQAKEERFMGMLGVMDIISHLVSKSSLNDPIQALNVSVSDIMTHDHTLLKSVAPGTRLIDALELIKGGTRRFLVPLSSGSPKLLRRMSAYKSSYASRLVLPANLELLLSKPEKPLGFCCLTIEDVARFLLGYLGALAPFPLQSIDSQNVINTNPPMISSTDPAKKALLVWQESPRNIQAVAVVEEIAGRQVLIGEISSIKLLRCGFRVAMALATLTAADFVAYVERFGDTTGASEWGKSWSEEHNKGLGAPLSFRRRTMPLTCRSSNSVAAVMAQVLAYRITHVWVVEEAGHLVGIVTYSDILAALTNIPTSMDTLMASVLATDIRWTP